MSVFSEILLVAKSGNGGTDQIRGQDDQSYLLSLAQCIAGCPGEQWEALSDEAKEWYDSVTRSSNAMLPIPEPEGYKPTELVKPAETQLIHKKADVVIIPAIKSILQIGEIKGQPKSKQKENGILDAIRKTVILHLDWTAKQVHQHLVENGYPNANANVVAVNAGDIRRVVAAVKELGFWREQQDRIEQKL
jgi:hypothetical protein